MKILLLFVSLIHCLDARDAGVAELQKTLTAHAGAFERVALKADGSVTRFVIELGVETAELEGATFDGFRFRCPEGVGGRDFVWYFNGPADWGEWYILPMEGEPERAFRNWIDADRIYRSLDQPAETGRMRILQTLGGRYFKPGGDYVMWFRNTGRPGPGTLRVAVSFAQKSDLWDAEGVEKALLLEPAPAGDQVAALHSRGGLILLDERFFTKNHARHRIEAALAGIRHTRRTSGGFFVTIRTFVPPCETNPSIEEIIKEHGPADFIRTGEELNRVRRHAGGDNEDGGDEDAGDVTSYHYDYFAFEVDSDGKDKTVRRVATYGSNFADVAPSGKEPGFGVIDIENLTVFHRDGREAGRAYFFLEGAKRPLFIATPPAGEYRDGNQLLISEGNGIWKWVSRFPDGKTARIIPLKHDVFDGMAEGFHANGNHSFRAGYRNGALNGETIRFDEDGKETSRRRFRDGKEVAK